jgi:DNA-binding response OmpR family regulator
MPVSQDAGTFFYVLEDDVRILFADDDPILQEFAMVHLSTKSAKVHTAADGLHAMQLIDEGEFDIVLLDLEMPNMDGFEVLTKLRADERFKRLPVIIVTGREDVSAIDKAFLAGATSFVVKPINWRLLSYQIRYVHRASQTEKSLEHARARARADAANASQTVRRLAKEGAEFLELATGRQPELKSLARDYVQLLGQLVPERVG